MAINHCGCLELGPRDGGFDEVFVGLDQTNGRFGEVSLGTCLDCGRRWVRYSVEYEGFTGSGRWFTAPLPPGVDSTIRADTAVSVIEQLPSHLYGGSYFGTTGRRGAGPLRMDL